MSLGTAFPKSSLAISKVRLLSESLPHHHCSRDHIPTTGFGAMTSQKWKYLFLFSSPLLIRAMQQIQDLTQYHAETSHSLPCSLQCWRESQAATAALVLCRSDSDRIGQHTLLLSHLCDEACTWRQPPCSTQIQFSKQHPALDRKQWVSHHEDRRKYKFYSSNHKLHTEEERSGTDGRKRIVLL